MTQDPMIAHAAEAARTYGGKQAEWYTAPCDLCGSDCRWSAVVSHTTDLARTTVEYTLDCPCAEAVFPVPAAPLEEIA